MKNQTAIDAFSPEIWPKGKELKFVNGDKFDRNELLGKLGWNSISTETVTDTNKIRVRQDGLKLFLRTKTLNRFFQGTDFPADYYRGKDFFEKFGQKSMFNKKTHRFIQALQAAANSPKFDSTTQTYQQVVTELKNKFEKIQVIENAAVEKLAVQLNSVYSYNGVVSMNGNLHKDNPTQMSNDVYGFKDYAFHTEDPGFVEISKIFLDLYGVSAPNWVVLCGLRLLQFVLLPLYILANVIVSFADKNKNDALYTRTMPQSVENELLRIRKVFLDDIRKGLREKFKSLNLYLSDDILDSVFVKTEFQFVLDSQQGFIVRLIDASTAIKVSDKYTKTMMYNQKDLFRIDDTIFEKGNSVYSKVKRMVFKWRSQKLSDDAALKFIKLPLMHALEGALVASQSLLVNGRDIVHEDSYLNMMNEVKYSGIDDAIKGTGLEADWKRVTDFRAEVLSFVAGLKELNSKAKTIGGTRKKFSNFPFSFPIILDDDKNIVSFDKLAPLHLIGRPNKNRTGNLESANLRLITGLPALNGQIVSITGQNGGGKTVIETELIHNLYLAHMGFPVFAEDFILNAKDIIAMVFVEKGEGSMLQLLMEKLKIVAQEVEKNPNNKIVVIIDELLTGTQEEDGYKIGCKYLKMLNNKKCSVMFVTQITRLAEYAKHELNALCFYFDKDGSMQKGIGTGNATFLAEEVGLDEYLKN